MQTAQRRKGFVLIATCLVLAVLLGLAGLATDAGRMYVVKSELQAFTDAAALSGALELDGGANGLRKAREAAGALTQGDHAMRWDLGSRPIAEFRLSFARGGEDPDEQTWHDAPREASDYHFVKVTARVVVPLTLLRAVPGVRRIRLR